MIGLQFHLESTPESVENIIRNCPGELIEDRYVQNADQVLGRREDFEYINRAMGELLARLMQNWRLSPMPDTRCLQRTLKRALRR